MSRIRRVDHSVVTGGVVDPKTASGKTAPQPTSFQDLTPSFEKFRGFIEKFGDTQTALKDFLGRRSAWFDAAGKTGDISHLRELIADSIKGYNQVQNHLNSPIPRCEEWQGPETFEIFDVQFQFLSISVPVIDLLITATGNLSKLMENHDGLRSSTPLTQRALDDFFTGVTEIKAGNIIKGGELIEETPRHAVLLERYEQVTIQYQKYLGRLRQLTSPLVGVDAPWRGYYEPENPEQTGYNPSLLPAEHLNAMPLQKAYQLADKKEWDTVFRIINRNPVTNEHKLGEMTADATWDPETRKFVRWSGDPWRRLEKATRERTIANDTMPEMIRMAETHVTTGGTLPEAIRAMESDIQSARKLITNMRGVWKGGFCAPSIPQYQGYLAPLIQHLDRAEGAINTAAGALCTGDEAMALHKFLQAQRFYVLAAQTPRFKSLLALAGDYETLSFYPKLGLTIAATATGAGLGALVAVGTEGALISSGATAMTIRLGALAANGATFAVTTSMLNHAFIDEPLPKGVGGWTYEVASNILLFGTLGKIGQKWGRPMGTLATGKLTQALGTRTTTWLGSRAVFVAGELAQMIPTYAFFTTTWTPVDMIGQQFANDAAFTPGDVVKRAYTPENFILQGGFLVGLRLGNSLAFRLIEPLYRRGANFANATMDTRLKALQGRREVLRRQLNVLIGHGTDDPVAVMLLGASLARSTAASAREELDLLTLFDSKILGIGSRRAELRGMDMAYTAAGQEFHSRSNLFAIFQDARVQGLATDLVSYDPAAFKSLQGLCKVRSPWFSMRDIGDGNFLFTWKDGRGETVMTTMVPTPQGPLSTATDIVPVQTGPAWGKMGQP